MFSNSNILSTVLILVRVDTQMDDKDIRHKCKQLENYTTKDFGLNEHIQLNFQLKQKINAIELSNIQEENEDEVNDTVRMTKNLQDFRISITSS